MNKLSFLKPNVPVNETAPHLEWSADPESHAWLDRAFAANYIDANKYLRLKNKYDNLRHLFFATGENPSGSIEWEEDRIVSFHHYSFLDHQETQEAVRTILTD